jgi:hypothetical protein
MAFLSNDVLHNFKLTKLFMDLRKRVCSVKLADMSNTHYSP